MHPQFDFAEYLSLTLGEGLGELVEVSCQLLTQLMDILDTTDDLGIPLGCVYLLLDHPSFGALYFGLLSNWYGGKLRGLTITVMC